MGPWSYAISPIERAGAACRCVELVCSYFQGLLAKGMSWGLGGWGKGLLWGDWG
jgi:hypothetical protein